MNKQFSLIALYIGAALMLCSIIFSFIITPVSINIGVLKVDDILSPLINLLGAVIVYYSFKEQRKANQIQIEALTKERDRASSINKFNQLINLMEDFERRYDTFSVLYISLADNQSGILTGEAAHHHFIESLEIFNKNQDAIIPVKDLQNKILEFSRFLNILNFVLQGIIEYKNDEDHSKEVLKIKMLEYTTKYFNVLFSMRDAIKSTPDSNVFIYLLEDTVNEYFEKLKALRKLSSKSNML